MHVEPCVSPGFGRLKLETHKFKAILCYMDYLKTKHYVSL